MQEETHSLRRDISTMVSLDTFPLYTLTIINIGASRNCTKHQVRCDYMDSPTAMMPESPQSPQQPNLLWTPEIEATIELWRQTGEFPFPDLRVYPQPQWRILTKTDLRLIHHLSSISNEMFRNRTSRSTLWTDMMPKYVLMSSIKTSIQEQN